MTSLLTEEQILEFKEVFMLFDKDNDGLISNKQLKKVMNSLGINSTESELRDMVNQIDMNNDGRVDFQDFLNLMCSKINTDYSEEGLKEAFKLFDKDQDGFISCSELRQIMIDFGIGEDITDEECYEIIKEANGNGDGKINYNDFVKMILDS